MNESTLAAIVIRSVEKMHFWYESREKELIKWVGLVVAAAAAKVIAAAAMDASKTWHIHTHSAALSFSPSLTHTHAHTHFIIFSERKSFVGSRLILL